MAVFSALKDDITNEEKDIYSVVENCRVVMRFSELYHLHEMIAYVQNLLSGQIKQKSWFAYRVCV